MPSGADSARAEEDMQPEEDVAPATDNAEEVEAPEESAPGPSQYRTAEPQETNIKGTGSWTKEEDAALLEAIKIVLR